MHFLPFVEPLLPATVWLSSFEEMSEGKMVLLPPLELHTHCSGGWVRLKYLECGCSLFFQSITSTAFPLTPQLLGSLRPPGRWSMCRMEFGTWAVVHRVYLLDSLLTLILQIMILLVVFLPLPVWPSTDSSFCSTSLPFMLRAGCAGSLCSPIFVFLREFSTVSQF